MQFFPDWTSLHPLVVHFPIALLLVAPVLALIGVLARRQRGLAAAALLLMVLGTAGAWLAVGTGEAAGEAAESTPGIEPVLERHGDMAETTGTLFTVLTLAYAALILAPWALKRKPLRVAELAAHGAFLAVYAVAAVYLARTAQQGGLLVHQYGVHAAGQSAPAAENERERHDDRD